MPIDIGKQVQLIYSIFILKAFYGIEVARIFVTGRGRRVISNGVLIERRENFVWGAILLEVLPRFPNQATILTDSRYSVRRESLLDEAISEYYRRLIAAIPEDMTHAIFVSKLR